MADMTEAFQGDNLSAKDYEEGESLTLTVKAIKCEEFDDRENEGEKVAKYVLYFNEKKPGLELNRSNGKTMIGLYGKDSDGWIGKPISILVASSGVGPWFKIRDKAPKVEAKL